MTRLNGYFLRNRLYLLEVQGNFLKAQIYPTERPLGLFKCGKNAGKYAKMSIKLETLLLQLRLRNEKSITD